MSRTMKTAITLALTATLLSACQEKKQLAEMHANTKEMNETTGKMATSMDKTLTHLEEMNNKTSKISANAAEANVNTAKVVGTADATLAVINESLDVGRQGGALDLRNNVFETLIKHTTPLDTKLVKAGEYFMAFEFQVWSGLGQDAEGKANQAREKLALEAVTEFFKKLKTVSHWESDEIDPFAKPKPVAIDDYRLSNQKAVFNSLAAALHKTNRKQDRLEMFTKFDKFSMFSLIQDALLASAQIKAGKKNIEDYPEYVNEVLKEEPLAIRLMQARYNMLGLIFLGRVTKISDSLWEGFLLKVWGASWTLNLDAANISQVRFYSAHFEEAQKTAALLTKIGASAALDKSLGKMLSNMKVQSSSDIAAETASAKLAKQTLVDLIGRYTKVK